MNFYAPKQALPIMRGFLPGIGTGLSLRLVGLRGLAAEITCKRGPT